MTDPDRELAALLATRPGERAAAAFVTLLAALEKMLRLPPPGAERKTP